MLDPIVDVAGLMKAIREDDAAGIDACLSHVSDWEADILSGIYFIKEGIDFHSRLLGVQSLSSYCRNRGDLISAMALAQAAFDELDEDELVLSGQRPDLTHMAANLLDVLATGLVETGHAHQVTRDADRWAEWVARANMSDYYLAQIRLSQIEALILSGDYDRARQLLLLVSELELEPGQALVLQRLAAKMPVLLRAVDEPEPPPVDLQQVLTTSVEVMRRLADGEPTAAAVDALSNLVSGAQATRESESIDVGSLSEMPGFADLAQMAAGFGFVPPPASVDEIAQRAAQLEDARNPNGALMGLLDGLGALFQDEHLGHDRETLVKTLTPLKQTTAYARRLEFWEHQMSADWLQAIALKRLGRLEQATDVLRALRDEIDRKRLSIADPRNRAGISVYLQHLYAVSAEVLYHLDDDYVEELFHVIETAKSKILAELSGMHTPVAGDTDSRTLRKLEEQTLVKLRELISESSSRAVYVSFLVDVDATYAVAVDPLGKLHKNRIPVSKDTVDQAARQLGELCNGSVRNLALSRPIDPGNPWERPFDPVIQSLSPLIDWIPASVGETNVLCLSPDGAMFNVPLHMLEVEREPLTLKVGVSIVPSAKMLLRCASQQGQSKVLPAACAFLVPQKGESGDTGKEDSTFGRVADWLAERIPTTIIKGSDADLARLRSEDLARKLVFIAAHGEFRRQDPLGASGIYLAFQGVLPGEGKGKANHLVTPQQFSRLELSASHVILLACVSGETTEITSREALGMIWAVFQAGASSTLTASWKVNLPSSADLLEAIFDCWINERESLGKAHQHGMQNLRAKGNSFSHPFHWAPLVLYGYWE